MASELPLNLIEMSAVREMANIGLGNATTALSEMTGKTFHMAVPDVESLEYEQLPALMGGGEAQTAGIYMPIEGDVPGHIAFLMPWRSAQALWRMLLGSQPQSQFEISEMDASAMLEVGNIINSSFLNAIADMTGFAMHATPSSLAIEMCSAILDAIMVEASEKDHYALAIRTIISDYEGSIEGFFVYVPSAWGLQILVSSLGLSEAA